MDNIANSSVYRGVEGSGEAQILGNSFNPMIAARQKMAHDQQQKQQEVQAKAARDKKWSELMDWAPDQRWEPFDKQVRDSARGLMDFEVEAAKSGVDPDNPDFRRMVKERKDMINLIASKSNHLKNTYDEVKKTFADDKKGYFDQNYYLQKLNDVYMDPNGNGHAIMDIDVQNARSILDDPEGYNIEAISRDFVSELPEQLIETYQKKADALGEMFDKESFKSKIFLRSPDGKLKFDENNNPILKLSPEVMRAAMQDPLISNYVNSRTEGDKTKEAEVLREILTPHDAVEYKNTPSGITKWDSDNKWGMGYTVDPKRIDVRFKTVRDAIYNFDESSLNQAFQSIKGVSVRFEGDKNLPGESRPDRIVVEIREPGNDPNTGNPKEPRTIKIPINTAEQMETAMFQLNEMIDEAQGSAGLRIGQDNFQLYYDNWLKTHQPDTGGTYTPIKKESSEQKSTTGDIY